MSASSAVTLRLDHLSQAAQSLATTSPAVSGHLRTAQRRLANGEGRSIPTPAHLQLCKACGNSLILGWNSERLGKGAASKKRTRQDRLQRKGGAETIDVRCSACDSVNTIQPLKHAVASAQSIERQLPVKVQTTKSPISQASEVPKVPSTEVTTASGAKKRNRNKKSSLQSMLDSRKPTTQTKGFGLGLADFMTG